MVFAQDPSLKRSQPPDRDDCNDDLQGGDCYRGTTYREGPQPSCPNQAPDVVFAFMLFLRMAVDAQAAQELQAYESPKSPEEKEPPDQRPKAPLQSRDHVLEEKDEEER